MRQLTPKRLSAWLLTLIMLVGMLPAMASADEADDDPSPPAPQEDYGYVRLVFDEGGQLDLHHGEYITECSPTAEVFGSAGEDFIANGEYAALYYEGRLYHKAALDGVSIDADAVLSAEDFARVPMGELAAQTPPSSTEGTTGGTTEGTTGGTAGDTTEQREPLPPTTLVRKAPMLTAASDAFGEARLTFVKDSVLTDQVIKLKGYQYITECRVGATVYDVPELERPEFKTTGKYVAYMSGSSLYLKGDLNGACIDLQYVKSPGGVDVFVQGDTTMSGNHCLLYNFRNSIDLHILPGKTLTMNLERPGAFRYTGAIRTQEGGDVTITGGGTLNINFNGDPTVENGIPVSGINAGKVTLEYRKYSQFIGSPTVNINMNNGGSGPEGDAVTGIIAGRLTVKDDAKLSIEVSGRSVKNSGESDSGGRVNRAISSGTMQVLNNASVDIISRKNVVTDIYLFGDGEALTVNTTGHLNIKNQSIVTFADQSDEWNRRFGYPSSNIYLKEKSATFKLEKAEGGVSIDSNSSTVDTWYTGGTFDLDWYWPVHGNITLGPNMYRGNHRVDQQINLGSSSYLYTWGFAQYIYSTTGVATVKQSSGLTMDWEKPEGAASSVHYARVIEPGFNDIYIVHKGADLSLEAPEGKGTFLYWYDALHPTDSGSTSWTKPNQTFTNIRQDMVLVPVRDPMKNGPTLSAVGYKEQWDNDLGTNIRYAYQDMTFAKEDNISTSGGYEVMLVPAQLPKYGEKTYAAKNLKGSPIMDLRNSRLYADKNAYVTDGAMNGSFLQIPTGSYRIAYNDDETGRCFFSKPFTFNPDVAPPYIDPVTQFYDSGGTKTVKITAERNATIRYRLWDCAKNQWGSLQDYTDPFDVTVTADQDVRIEAYAGPITKEITSEVRYALRPTGVPTVKYGDQVLSTTEANLPNRYFYGSIELTVEAPEGYEVWYNNNQAPYETSGGINGIEVKDGKVTLNYSGEFHFKLAKVVTVGGQKYRSLSHSVTKVKLVKQNELPAPNVTVKTKEGGTTLTLSGPNTYTMTENVVTVTLESTMSWPLNATIAYDTNGNATPRLSKNYTTPFEVRGAGTLAVFTLVPKADGGYDYEGAAYTFKLAESLQTVPVSTYGGNCTASYRKEDGSWEGIFSYSKELKVGTRVKVTPNPPDGQVLKKWEIVNYDAYNIWGDYLTDEVYKPVLFFNVPKPQYSSYGSEPKTLSIKATFASAAEANISGQTLVGLDMSKTVGESISLWDTTKDMRTISCQWWVGDRAGTEDNALPGAVKFDPNKTYTVKVTITANPGASFASSAGVAIGHYGGHFTVPNSKIARTNDTLTFTATPIRQIDLTMPAPLTVGDPLPTTADVEGLPAGVTVQALTWPGTSGNTVPEPVYDTVSAALTLKADGTHPILVGEYPPYPTVNGEEYVYASNSVTDGSKVTINIALPVKSKGVSVSGTAVSWNNTDNAEYRLYDGSTSDAAIKAEWKTDSYTGTACTSKGTPTASGKQFTQTFQFDTVAEGKYKLVIFKPDKYVPKIVPITVESTALDLGQLKLWLYGDVNYDGAIKAIDVTMARQYFKGNLSSLTDEQICAIDMNGDGSIKAIDITILRQYFKGNISTIPVA